jgi:hypothetical protein
MPAMTIKFPKGLSMKKYLGFLFLLLPLFITIAFSGCSSESDSPPTVVRYAGSVPVGDFVEIQLDRTNSMVRRINYTNPSEDSGWLSFSSLTVSDPLASGFSLLNLVNLDDGGYVLFAEFPDTALVYQVFDSLDEADGWPAYVVLRETVSTSNYYEKSYNWMKFNIEPVPTTDSAMEAGFAAFDATAAEGMLYGAGYYSLDDTVTDINTGDGVKMDSFVSNPELVANTLWTDTEGDMNTALTLTGTASGTNIIDFGPDIGGGSGLAIPQSAITLAEAAGTYFVLCYENNQTTQTNTVKPLKVVISAASPHIKVFDYEDRTDTGTPVFSSDLIAIADLTAVNSPGGTVAIAEQFATASGLSGASSTAISTASECQGSFVALGTDQVINILFDPNGGFCGFSMSDNASDNIIRFGFGINDAAYANQ